MSPSVPSAARLSGWDMMHLDIETARQNSNVMGIHLVEHPLGNSREAAESIAAAIERRVLDAPPFRYVLHRTTGDPDFPRWRYAPEFRPTEHITVGSVDADRSEADVDSEVARQLSQRFDRTRPLWHITVLSGHSDGYLVVLWKMHHSMVDAPVGRRMSGFMALDEDEARQFTWSTAGDEPDPGRRQTILAGLILRAKKIRTLPALVRETATFLRLWARVDPSNALAPLFSGPRVRWSKTLSGQLSYTRSTLDLSTIRLISQTTGTSVNSVFMCITGQALLEESRAAEAPRPRRSLVSMVPVEIPANKPSGYRYATTGINTVTSLNCTLRTDVDDLVERVHAIHHGMRQARELVVARPVNLARAWTEHSMSSLLHSVIRGLEITRVADRTRPVANAIVTSVDSRLPNPRFMGLPMRAVFPAGPIYSAVGVNVTAYTSGGYAHVGVVTDASAPGLALNIAEALPRILDRLHDEVTRAYDADFDDLPDVQPKAAQ